jgi:tetratricopeptide (TPR) repeat protein
LSVENPSVSGKAVSEGSSDTLERMVLFCCGFLIAIHFVASFFPQARLWGLNQLHYFPLIFRIILCAVALAVLFPRASQMVTGFLGTAFAWIADRFAGVNKHVKYSAVGLVSTLVFWLLRTATPLLGDGYLRAGQLKFGVLLELTEPLDFYLHLLAFRWFGWDGYTTYAILSCLAGGVFVFLALLLCDAWGRNRSERFLVLVMLVTMGSMQLFFGYVESYSLMYVLLAAYLLAGLLYLKGEAEFVWPCLFLLLAGGFHLAAFFALPSLFLLAWAKVPSPSEEGPKGFGFARAMYLGGVLFVMTVGLYLLRTYALERPPSSVLIYPFGSNESLYSFFSIAHWLDFLNEQLLISPVGALVLFALLVFFRRSIDFKDTALKFLLWVMLCLFVFALLIDPKLGYARDWDLFAFTGMGVTFLGAYLVLGLARRENGRNLSRITLALALTALVSTLPWLLVNASEHRAVARLEDLLQMDRQMAGHGYEILACYFRDKGDHRESLELWKKAIAANPNPRYFASLGNEYRRVDQDEKAVEAYRKALEEGVDLPSRPGLYSNLGNTLAQLGRYDEAEAEMKKAISLRPDKAEYYFNLGNILGRAERYPEAARYFETALRLNPDNIRIYKVLGWTYARLGEVEKAKACFERYLRSAPADGRQIKGLIDSIQIEIDSGR